MLWKDFDGSQGDPCAPPQPAARRPVDPAARVADGCTMFTS